MLSESKIRLDPKIAMDIGRGLVTLLIGIAAFLLALLGVYSFEHVGKDTIPLVLLCFSVLSMMLATRIIDWMLDRISYRSWAALYEIDDSEQLKRFEKEYYKWGGAYFRIRIYGGSYLAFSIFIGLVASGSLFFAIAEAQEMGFVISISESIGWKTKLRTFICLIILIIIPYEMLTIGHKIGRYFYMGIIFFILVLVVEAFLRIAFEI